LSDYAIIALACKLGRYLVFGALVSMFVVCSSAVKIVSSERRLPHPLA
jgi:hypothetical protein